MPETRRSVIRDSAGVGLATGAYGVSFGAISSAVHLSLLQTCALSALMFTGASQFALVGVLGAGGAAPAAALTAILLGSRNALYGLRLSALLDLRGWRRPLAAQLVIDESTAMGTGRDSVELGRVGFWATGVAVFACWNIGTLAGALGARALSDPRVYGLDAAVPAAFLALLAPRLSSGRARGVALGAMAVALAAATLLPVGVPVLLAGVAALAAGLLSPADARRRRRGAMSTWTAVLAGSVGCYILKLGGVSIPRRVLDNRRIRLTAELLPIALLSALIAIQTFSSGHRLVLDARAAGLAAAGLAVLLRAPFLVVVATAAIATALLRLALH